MRNLLLIFLVFITLSSCKKFKHAELTMPNCSLCAFADSLNGTYRGHAYGIGVPYSFTGDSVTMTVEQIFLNKSQYEDSTVMHFRTTYKYDHASDTKYDTIRIKSSLGKVEDHAYLRYASYASTIYEGNYYVIQPDMVKMEAIGTIDHSAMVVYHGALYRE